MFVLLCYSSGSWLIAIVSDVADFICLFFLFYAFFLVFWPLLWCCCYVSNLGWFASYYVIYIFWLISCCLITSCFLSLVDFMLLDHSFYFSCFSLALPFYLLCFRTEFYTSHGIKGWFAQPILPHTMLFPKDKFGWAQKTYLPFNGICYLLSVWLLSCQIIFFIWVWNVLTISIFCS